MPGGSRLGGKSSSWRRMVTGVLAMAVSRIKAIIPGDIHQVWDVVLGEVYLAHGFEQN